ncbi:MAG: GNAT family N-acetyltransferase [Melioribacteraceae bacterium]|nr:GNAT family N-acetyltransferase [Melioribacteraceae bacterium]
MNLTYKTLSTANWSDFEKLFGEKGACGGCWCMYWRLNSQEFEKNKGTGNKNLMKKIAKTDTSPGILAYHEKKPVGWCSFAKRNELPRLSSSRNLKVIDNAEVLSIVCFYIHKDYRNKGIATELVKKVETIARKQGIKILEGYPVDKLEKYPDTFAWTGFVSSFRKNGFEEVIRRSESRPIMRKYLT